MAGTQLRRNNAIWVPHGAVDVAFVAPPKAAKGVFATAYRRFSPASMRALHAWGADSVRFQVSQPGLDPHDALYDPAFRARVIAGVRAARAAGLVAIVSVQDETQSGQVGSPTALPDAATERVWSELAPAFNGDRGVLYELLNEPRLSPSRANWARWGDAMTSTIRTIRSTGSHNVVIADGLLEAERLQGAPPLADPLHEVIYASHPYAHDASGQEKQAWDQRFGEFARTHPTIVTEWTTIPSYFCNSGTAKAGAAFVDYVRTRGIGLMAFAWDFDGAQFGSLAYGASHATSTYAGKTCGQTGFGPGQVVQDWYRHG